jgi:uncharacterized membrane protein
MATKAKAKAKAKTTAKAKVTARPKAHSDGNDVSNNKTMAILAYFLFFIPMLGSKKSKFAMFHANQSLILLIISVGSNLVIGMIPGVGGALSGLIGLGVFILWVMGILNAANGEVKPLPLVGGYTLIK